MLTTRRNLEDLGIRQADGSFDFEVLKAAGSFMREQRYSGAPEFDLLQAHLRRLFPEKLGDTGLTSPGEGIH